MNKPLRLLRAAGVGALSFGLALAAGSGFSSAEPIPSSSSPVPLVATPAALAPVTEAITAIPIATSAPATPPVSLGGSWTGSARGAVRLGTAGITASQSFGSSWYASTSSGTGRARASGQGQVAVSGRFALDGSGTEALSGLGELANPSGLSGLSTLPAELPAATSGLGRPSGDAVDATSLALPLTADAMGSGTSTSVSGHGHAVVSGSTASSTARAVSAITGASHATVSGPGRVSGHASSSSNLHVATGSTGSGAGLLGGL